MNYRSAHRVFCLLPRLQDMDLMSIMPTIERVVQDWPAATLEDLEALVRIFGTEPHWNSSHARPMMAT